MNFLEQELEKIQGISLTRTPKKEFIHDEKEIKKEENGFTYHVRINEKDDILIFAGIFKKEIVSIFGNELIEKYFLRCIDENVQYDCLKYGHGAFIPILRVYESAFIYDMIHVTKNFAKGINEYYFKLREYDTDDFNEDFIKYIAKHEFGIEIVENKETGISPYLLLVDKCSVLDSIYFENKEKVFSRGGVMLGQVASFCVKKENEFSSFNLVLRHPEGFKNGKLEIIVSIDADVEKISVKQIYKCIIDKMKDYYKFEDFSPFK